MFCSAKWGCFCHPHQAQRNCPASLSEALAPRLRPHLAASFGGGMESLGGLGGSQVVDQVLSLVVSTQSFHSVLCPRALPPVGWGGSGGWEWGGTRGGRAAGLLGGVSVQLPHPASSLSPRSIFQRSPSALTPCPILDSSSGVLGHGTWVEEGSMVFSSNWVWVWVPVLPRPER